MKVLEFNPKNNLNINHRKENYFQYEYSIIVFDANSKRFFTPLILRIYCTPSINYACVWLPNQAESSVKGDSFDNDHRTAKKALIKAGFVFDSPHTTDNIGFFLKAIAEYFGYKHYYIHKSNP